MGCAVTRCFVFLSSGEKCVLYEGEGRQKKINTCFSGCWKWERGCRYVCLLCLKDSKLIIARNGAFEDVRKHCMPEKKIMLFSNYFIYYVLLRHEDTSL